MKYLIIPLLSGGIPADSDQDMLQKLEYIANFKS